MNSLSPVESFTRFTCFSSIIFADINWLTGSCLIVSNPSITFADTLVSGACFVRAGLVGGTVFTGPPANDLLLLIYHWPRWRWGEVCGVEVDS